MLRHSTLINTEFEMADVRTSNDSKRIALIKRNLSDVVGNLHQHVVSLGGHPPPGQNNSGDQENSTSDLDQIEHLTNRVVTLCSFMQSLSSSPNDRNHEVNMMWKWIQWLKRNITPYSEDKMPSEPEGTGETSETSSKVQETGRIIKQTWEHNQRILRERQEILNINMRQSQDIDDMDSILHKDKKQNFKQKLERLRSREKILNEDLLKVTHEKDYWINRMSSMAGKKLRDNNSEVIDLSDPNGPLKLADKFSELYDNQWTTVLDELQTACKRTEKMAIQQLSSLLKESYKCCFEKARRQLQCLQTIVLTGTWEDIAGKGYSNPDRDKAPSVLEITDPVKVKTLKDTRKELSHLAKERVIKDLLPVMLKTISDGQEMTSMTDYLSECLSLCWSMAVQDPPVVLHWPLNGQGHDIDRDKFNLYTKTGKKLNYEVWPALLLHANGPLLKKGVVQPQ